MGVLNNAVYATLFEEGRLLWCRELGLIGGFGAFPFVLAALQVRFLAPGRGGAAVELQMATTALGVKSFTQAYRLIGEDGAVWAEAEAVMVTWDSARRRAGPMAQAFRAAIVAREPHLAQR